MRTFKVLSIMIVVLLLFIMILISSNIFDDSADGQATMSSQNNFRKPSNKVIKQNSDGVDVPQVNDVKSSNSDPNQLIEKNGLVLQPYYSEMSDVDKAVYKADMQAWEDSDQPIRFGESGMTVDEYFQQDTYDIDWSKKTEDSFYQVFVDPVFLEKFPTHGVYENQCKRTMCKISMNNGTFTPEFIAYFTLTPNAERFRSVSMVPGDFGGMHMYVYRGER